MEGAGIVDVIDMANTMANLTDRVAACRVPPVLSSERIIVIMMKIKANLNTRVPAAPRARPFSPSGTHQHKGVLQYRQRESAHGPPSYIDQRKEVELVI